MADLMPEPPNAGAVRSEGDFVPAEITPGSNVAGDDIAGLTSSVSHPFGRCTEPLFPFHGPRKRLADLTTLYAPVRRLELADQGIVPTPPGPLVHSEGGGVFCLRFAYNFFNPFQAQRSRSTTTWTAGKNSREFRLEALPILDG